MLKSIFINTLLFSHAISVNGRKLNDPTLLSDDFQTTYEELELDEPYSTREDFEIVEPVEDVLLGTPPTDDGARDEKVEEVLFRSPSPPPPPPYPSTDDGARDEKVEEVKPLIIEDIKPVNITLDNCYSTCKVHFHDDDSSLSKTDVERLTEGRDVLLPSGERVSLDESKSEFVLTNEDVIEVHGNEIVRVRDNRVVDINSGKPTDLKDEDIEKLRRGEVVRLDNGEDVRMREDNEIMRERDGLLVCIESEDRESLVRGAPRHLRDEEITRLRDGDEVTLEDGEKVRMVEGKVLREDGSEMRTRESLVRDIDERKMEDLRKGNEVTLEDGEKVRMVEDKILREDGSEILVAASRIPHEDINKLVDGDVITYRGQDIRLLEGKIVRTGDWEEVTIMDEDMKKIISSEEEQCNNLCSLGADKCHLKCKDDSLCMKRCAGNMVDAYYEFSQESGASVLTFGVVGMLIALN